MTRPSSSRSTSPPPRRAAFLQALAQPTTLFGSILLVLVWLTTAIKLKDEARARFADGLSELTTLTLLLEQDAQRTTAELDRVIRFLRRSYERSGRSADWADLVQEDYTVNARTVQIAVIDANGRMITSSAMVRPKTPVDLADREHYRFHRDSKADVLHVSRPVIGRASGRWSVQFTRRFSDADGAFGGVIVVSLDPEQALSIIHRLQPFPDAGFAILGDDDIIRAGAGSFAALIGRGFVEGPARGSYAAKDDNISVTTQTFGGKPFITAIKRVQGMPLSVVARIRAPADGFATLNHPYIVLASAFSLSILLAMIAFQRRQRKHLRSITTLAHNDQLTQLANRLSFQNRMAAAFADASEPPAIALHLIDLDHFKAVNDTYGHPVGDELLCAVARRLKAAVRESDHVFRLSGDEFALIQTDCVNADQAEVVARRLCRVMAEPFEIARRRLKIGASIGIATPSRELADPTALLRAADMALYRAKGDGRGSFARYDHTLGAAMLRRKLLEADLSSAIKDDQLEIHFQPKVDLARDNRVVGYEALVRWRHPQHGMMPPLEFIGIAEESGFIVPLGAWLLSTVCRRFAALPGEATIAVNCSPIQFSRSDLAATIAAALATSGLEPHRLEIEITESTLMLEEKTVVCQLERIRALGVRVSLDDFGTGYSSLAYIERYPIDCIKIDRTFVAKLGKDARADAITRTVITLARELKINAVAEGIETAEQAHVLRLLGCPIGQGYLFGRPEPAEKIWPTRLAAGARAS